MRYLDRNDNAQTRPWPASPYEYPLTDMPPTRYPWGVVAYVAVGAAVGGLGTVGVLIFLAALLA